MMLRNLIPNIRSSRIIIPSWLLGLLLVIAALGFVDATYLTVEHYINANPPCFIGSCELVLSSAYSTLAGIPVALFGAVYYLCILIGLLFYVESKKETVLRITLGATILGFLASAYFFILQAFVLHAFCQYCLGSVTTSTVLFVIAVLIFLRSLSKKGSA